MISQSLAIGIGLSEVFFQLQGAGGPPPPASALLLEDATYILQEDGTSHILLE